MILKRGIAIAAIAGLGLIACGDDEPSNNSSNNTSTNNTQTNNTQTNNTQTNNTQTNNTQTNNTSTNNNNNTPDVAPPGCDDPNPPARCAESPDGFAWGTASIIDTFAVASEEEPCCFDYNGDGAPDNALGGILGLLGDVNASIQEGIDSGSIVIALEHAGLTSFDGGDFTVNFWLASWDGITAIDPAGGNTIVIDPAAIDAGTQPQAYVPGAVLAGTDVTAGPGTIALSIDLLGAPISLTISGARISAQVNTAASSLENGVALTDGKIGGYVKLEDLFTAVNAYAGTCTCLGLPAQTDLITWDPATLTGSCATVSAVNLEACETEGNSGCATLGGTMCGTLLNLAPGLADVDADKDGTEDSMSIGATFTAVGAKITGVAAAN